MEIVDPCIPVTLLPPGSVARILNGPHREYRDLPAIVTPTGRVISRWTFTEEERARIAAGEDMYLMMLSGGSINPVSLTVGVCDWSAP